MYHGNKALGEDSLWEQQHGLIPNISGLRVGAQGRASSSRGECPQLL